MNCKVVTIARTLQAGGEEVGRLVAEELGFSYLDDEIIQRAAERAGVSPEVVEKAEHRQPLVVRLLEAMATTPPADTFGWGTQAMPITGSSASYQDFIIAVIRETAEEGNVAIVAHGAGVCLAGRKGVFRVLVTASPELRANRLGGQQASKIIENSDRDRIDFLRRFYGLKDELASTYDLVLTTDTLSVGAAAHIVAAAARVC